MGVDARKQALAQRQERVGKVVWGLLLITMGIVFSLHNSGHIVLDQPSRPSRYPASNAVDGSPKTRWSSGFDDPQWLEVDLGAPAALTRFKLNWESAHAREYQIQVSDDQAHWTTVVSADDRHGGIEEHEVQARGRYVRLYGIKRSTPYGYSLWEFEVYGTGASSPEGPAQLLSRDRPASASSLEGRIEPQFLAYWWHYWPLLLVAFGLPSLLAPRNDGDHLWGLLATGAGVLAELHALGLTPWGLAQSLPVVLMLGGALLVLQSMRRARRAADDADGDGQGGVA